MKATVDQLKAYAFCPKFFEQEGIFPIDQSSKDFQRLVIYAFRYEFEKEIKPSWSSIEKKWNKIFFESHSQDIDTENLKKYNRSLIAINKFYDWFISVDFAIYAVGKTNISRLDMALNESIK